MTENFPRTTESPAKEPANEYRRKAAVQRDAPAMAAASSSGASASAARVRLSGSVAVSLYRSTAYRSPDRRMARGEFLTKRSSAVGRYAEVDSEEVALNLESSLGTVRT
jgi:hypothetical protein